MPYKCADGREVPFVENLQARLPECLQDDATFLIEERGYTQAELGKLGVRCAAAIEGYMSRGDSAALLRLLVTTPFGQGQDVAAQMALKAVKSPPV